MLKAAIDIDRALQKAGIRPPASHPHIVEVSPSSWRLLFRFSPEGEIMEAEALRPKEPRFAWKYLLAPNTGTWPVFPAAWDADAGNIAAVRSVNIARGRELAERLGDGLPLSMARLADIVGTFGSEELLIEELRRGIAAFLGEENRAAINKAAINKDIAILLDLSRPPNGAMAIHTPETRQAVAQALIESDRLGEADGVCVISGEKACIQRGPVAPQDFPTLGKVAAFARNKAIPALARYGLNGPESLGAGVQTIIRAGDALAWITAEERRGRTWATVPSSSAPGRDLLLAYVDGLPEVGKFPLATFLASNRTEENKAETYAEIAGSLVAALRGNRQKSQTLPGHSARIRSTTIRKHGKSGTAASVLADANYTLEAVLKAAEDWLDAMDNIPGWLKKSQGDYDFPGSLSPGRLAKTVGDRWILSRGKLETSKQSRPLPPDAARDLLLGSERERKRAAALAIARLERNARSLLGASAPLALKAGTLRAAGLLLHKLGRPPAWREPEGEDTMTTSTATNSPFYIIGLVAREMDLLHLAYCGGVRRGDTPAQLCGARHMRAILANPARGLETMLRRALPYRSWAQTAKKRGEKGKNAEHAFWALNRYGKLAGLLHEAVGISSRPTPAERLEIEFGYAAPNAYEYLVERGLISSKEQAEPREPEAPTDSLGDSR